MSRSNKLSLEEQEALVEFLLSDSYKAALSVLFQLVEVEEARVLQYNLEAGDEKSLAYLKSRAEGAKKLAVSYKAHLDKIRLAALQASEKARSEK